MWDVLEIDWSNIKVTFNGKVINLLKSIMVKLWDKFKVRHMMESQPILFHLMLKQGFNWLMLTPKEQETENIYHVNLIFQNIAREINPVCNLFFGFMHKNLPTDTVDVELTIRMVKGIYIYHKDHTAESTIFTLWSKSVTPFPSLRKKIKAFKEDSRGHSTPTWTPLVNTTTKPPRNPRKHTSGKVRTRWSNCNHCFNPIKTNWVNTLGTDPTDANKINI